MRRVSSGLIKGRRVTRSVLKPFQTVVCLYLLINIKNIFPILRGTEYKLNSVLFNKTCRKNSKFPVISSVVLRQPFIIMSIKAVIIIVMLNRSSSSSLGTGRVAKSKKRRNFFMLLFFFLNF